MQGKLVYFSDHIVLDEHILQPGALIELRIMNYWIPGYIERDKTGWYLVSFDQVGIRLNTGLVARFPETPPTWTRFSHQSHDDIQNEERS